MIASDIKIGDILIINGEKLEIRSKTHVQPGKGGAYIQAVGFNILTGKKNEIRLRVSEKVDKIDVFERKYIYIYKENNNLIFLNEEDCSTVEIDGTLVEKNEFLNENDKVNLLFTSEDEFLKVHLPKTCIGIIQETSDYNRGKADGSCEKMALLTNGASIKVPQYVANGDKIEINTEDLSFVKRILP
jgi:elongation factor P